MFHTIHIKRSWISQAVWMTRTFWSRISHEISNTNRGCLGQLFFQTACLEWSCFCKKAGQTRDLRGVGFGLDDEFFRMLPKSNFEASFLKQLNDLDLNMKKSAMCLNDWVSQRKCRELFGGVPWVPGYVFNINTDVPTIAGAPTILIFILERHPWSRNPKSPLKCRND